MIHKVFILFFLSLITFTSGFSQNDPLAVRINYSATDIPLADALKEIEKITSIRFTFNSAIISDSERITISIQQKTLQEALTIILKNKYSFKVIGNQILIYEPPQKQHTNIKQNSPPPPTLQKPKKTIVDTIKVFDTITTYKVDTIRFQIYDTIKIYDTISHISKPNKNNKNTLTISFNTGQLFSIPFTTNAINNSYKELLSTSEQIGWSNTQSIRGIYERQKLLLGIGIQHLPIKYLNAYTSKTLVNDGSVTYTDSLWYWKYTELFTYYKFNDSGDSVAITVYDSTYTYKIVENPMKIEKETTINSTVSIHYISIPVSIGYSFNWQNGFSCNPLFSVYTQFLTVRKGVITGNNNDIFSIKDLPLKRINYSLGMSCIARYSFQSNYSITVQPFLIIQPNIYKKQNLFQQTISSFGIEWGISYTIPYDLF